MAGLTDTRTLTGAVTMVGVFRSDQAARAAARAILERAGAVAVRRERSAETV